VSATNNAAVVNARFEGRAGEMVNGVATFRTIGAALEGIPQNGIGRAVIFVKNGRYHEKLTVERPYITRAARVEMARC
jgi:pectinesterase